MTLVLTTNALGELRGTPVVMPNRRRRLSTIVSRHRPSGRQNFIVSVHKRGDEHERYYANDKTTRLKAQWSKTLLGPKDVVVITTVPRGKSFLAIGLAIASIALIAIAPYAAPVIAGAAVFGAGAGAAAGGLTIAIQAGLVIGGVALGYAAQMAKSAGQNKKKLEAYSLSGGGNVPKPNSRRPLLYGRCWSSPPLSQQDFIRIDGGGADTSQVIVKRMTLGIGKFQCHKLKVGDALFWDENTGIQAPFNKSTGDQGAAIEFLHESSSTIMPGDVFTSSSVTGQEVPRKGGNPDRSPWYRLTPQGVVADAAQMNWTYPAIYRLNKEGKEKGTSAGIVFYGRKIDPNTGNVIGPEIILWESHEPDPAFIRSPLKRNAYFRLPEPNSTYEVSAQNPNTEAPPEETQENRVIWEGMYAFKDDTRIRPQTTEIVFRMKAVKGVTVTAYSDITVEATRIIPVWDGNSWSDQPTRKAVWAYCDLVRSIYGLNLPNGVDRSKALYYANLLNDDDTFDGQLPEVSSFWEAAGEVLLPFRCDPVKVGPIHTFVRDEARDEPRHVITRRQIIKDSASATYKTKVEGSDVIVEFNRDGDPKRPDEVRYSYGPRSRTPKRYKINGIVDGTHAMKHATWLAAVAVFRGNERKLTMEWDGRLVFPGDHALVDIWFLKVKSVWGVDRANGRMMTLDTDANISTDWGYGSIRTRVGREWGILRMRGVGKRGLELHPDDVTALQAKTGLQLVDVLNTENQGPTTIAMGDLSELQETFVARSSVPSDPDHVQIEMVKDDIRVWQLLDETPIVPAPIDASSLDEPLVPVISVLHARCNNIETGIEIVWGASETLGARNYEFDLTYDQSSWEVLSAFGPASTGRAMMRQQVDTPVTVRARAFGRTGLPGDYIYTTVTTVAPVVDGSFLTPLSVKIESLSAEAQAEVRSINELGKGALALGRDAIKEALEQGQDVTAQGLRSTGDALRTADDSLRGAIRQIEEVLNRIADASATVMTNSFNARETIKVGTKQNFAAIERVNEARISDNEAFAAITNSLATRLTIGEGKIVGNATAIQGLTTFVTNIDGRVTAQSQSITFLSSRIDSNDMSLAAQATATQQLTTRVTINEGNISTYATALTALQSVVTDQGGQIVGQATALDNLTTRVEINENSIVSVAARTVVLEASVRDQGGLIAGQGTALQSLTTRVTNTEQYAEVLTQSLTALGSTVYAQGQTISANSTAVDLLKTRATTSEGRIEAESSRVTSLTATVADEGAKTYGNTLAISSLQGRVISSEGRIEATAQSVTALTATVREEGAKTYGNTEAILSIQTRVTQTERGVEANSNFLTYLNNVVGNNYEAYVATAQATNQLQTRASNLEGQYSAQASSIQVLSTTVGSNTSTLTTYGTSIDGLKVQFGVTGYIDGSSGGFVFTGVRRLDGSASFILKITADVFVDGTITARTLAASNLIVNSAQIGDLIVATRSIGYRQITNVTPIVSDSQRAEAMITVRDGAQLAFWALAVNGPQAELNANVAPGSFNLIRNDDYSVFNIPNPAVYTGSGDSRRLRILQSPLIAFDSPPPGTYKYTAVTSAGAGQPGVVMLVVEYAR